MCTRSIVEYVLLWSVRQYEHYIQPVYNFIVTLSGSIICSKGAGRSIIGGGGHIHIFVFTDSQTKTIDFEI